MTFNRVAVRVCVALLLVGSIPLLAEARWFGKKPSPENDPALQIQTFQPPPESAMLSYCEPYRKEVADLSSKFILLRPFYTPRRLWLMSKYHKCTNDLMTQEHNYLKHVDIELPPSLPKMTPVVVPINKPEAKTGEINGSL